MNPNERERIEREAEEYVSKLLGTDADGVWRRNAVKDYIAGASTEHDKARNQAIDEVLEWIKEQQSNEMTDWGESLFNGAIRKLESLKTIS